MKKICIDITNKRYEKLVVIKKIKTNKWGQTVWLCKCDCGNKKEFIGNNLRRGYSKSCGCIIPNYKHGLVKKNDKRFYKIWQGIKQRCNNSNCPNYKRYGERGVKCLWNTVIEFKEDMYEEYLSHCDKYGEKQTTIDRIDSRGNYCKENCRWATYKVQNNNKI